MSTNDCPRQKTTGTEIHDVGDYEHEFDAHATHVFKHSETGLTVEMSESAGNRDGYGNTANGFRVIARRDDGDVVDHICGSAFGGYMPSKSDAWRAARQWMAERPNGELRGDEEVRY